MENNYSVYQHVTPDNMYYFGQTQNVERRWRNNGVEYKRTALQPYIEKFGWDNIQHIVLFRDQTRENALWIEDFLITTAQEDGVCINQRRSGLVSKEEGYNQEYYEQNKQQRREYQREYQRKNKDKVLEYKREYKRKNKDKVLEYKREYQRQYYQRKKQQIREQQKQYYEENKQQILEQQKQYYEENKQQRREHQCEYRQRKKKEQQFKEFGCLPLW